MEAATNDVGLIVLPNWRVLTLAVFVTDARASQNVVEGVIARVATSVYGAVIAP